ncbi:hypothetical protein D9611_003470 [Ephemerocybe angulata]|uniref:Uncharacterized protein n=1 Tax=Ephemerocybe angulata TaxID=980116 RepID=A0A8H5EYG3_9AGAR|nr:hypothetical protein D9611_003470 [Tulosesus angulatus]
MIVAITFPSRPKALTLASHRRSIFPSHAMESESLNASLVHAFISISIVSAVLFALMIFSALAFRKVQRCPIWYSFCASWLTFSASFSLLSFAGQQFNSSQDRDLCLAQAGLVYAAPFLVGCTSTGLVAQLLSTILDTISPNTTGANKRPLFVRILAIATPWSIWLAVLIGVLLSSSTHRDGVILSPNSTYCVVSYSPVPRLTAVFTTILCIIILSLEVVIAALLFRHRAVKDLFKQSVIMTTRVFVFTGVVLTAAVTGLSFVLTERRGAAFDVMISVGVSPAELDTR